MASRNYLINVQDMTLSDRKDYKLKALAAGLERSGLKGIGDINADVPGLAVLTEGQREKRLEIIRAYIATGMWPKSIDQRELATGPALSDFTPATATVLDQWNTAPLAVVGTPYSCFQAQLAPQLGVGRLLVFYGVSSDEPGPIPVSRLLFRRGGAAGNIQAMFDLEPQGARLEYGAFFSEPVIFDPNDVFAAQVLCRIVTALPALVCLWNFLFENSGNTIA